MRWYDPYPALRAGLDGLAAAPPTHRREAVRQALATLESLDEGVLERHIDHFPLSARRRRWYDEDPETWLLFNGLRYAHDGCRAAVAQVLAEALTRAAA